MKLLQFTQLTLGIWMRIFFTNNLIPHPNTRNPNFKHVVLLSNTTKATLERKSFLSLTLLDKLCLF